MLLLLSLLLAARFFGTTDTVAYEADAILGVYWTDNQEGKIEFYRRGNLYYGKVLEGKRIGKDIHNPDPSLRDRSTLGLELFKDFEFDGNREYTNGTIYNTDNGKTYKGKIWLEDNGQTLKLRGYLGPFYKTVTWARVQE